MYGEQSDFSTFSGLWEDSGRVAEEAEGGMFFLLDRIVVMEDSDDVGTFAFGFSGVDVVYEDDASAADAR